MVDCVDVVLLFGINLFICDCVCLLVFCVTWLLCYDSCVECCWFIGNSVVFVWVSYGAGTCWFAVFVYYALWLCLCRLLCCIVLFAYWLLLLGLCLMRLHGWFNVLVLLLLL